MQLSADIVKDTDTRSDHRMFVAMRIDRQLFGIEVQHVRDVLHNQHITPIPLAPPEVMGLLNLRGRIVTVIDMRRRLRLPPVPQSPTSTFVVLELKGEPYSLMVDTVMEVLTIPVAKIEKSPANLGEGWKNIATGIYKLQNELLVIVDAQTLLAL